MIRPDRFDFHSALLQNIRCEYHFQICSLTFLRKANSTERSAIDRIFYIDSTGYISRSLICNDEEAFHFLNGSGKTMRARASVKSKLNKN